MHLFLTWDILVQSRHHFSKQNLFEYYLDSVKPLSVCLVSIQVLVFAVI